MNLISCQHCGVILDKDVLHFDEWEDYVPIYDFGVCAFCHGKGYIEGGE
jgi:hypothetical protein